MSKGKLIFDANLLFYPDSGIVDSTVNTTFFQHWYSDGASLNVLTKRRSVSERRSHFQREKRH